MNRLLTAVLAGCALLILGGCSGTGDAAQMQPDTFVNGMKQAVPDDAELQEALAAEFERQGVNPQRPTSSPPQGDGNAVFDLTAQPYDPDGPEGPEPMHIRLSWTERLLGDYDQNGEVLASDLSALAQNFGTRVYYKGASEAGAGDVPVGEPSSLNWRMARIDGDASGEVGLSDLSVIAQHFGESIDGYRIYRLAPDSLAYFMVPHPSNDSLPFTVGRYEAGGGGKQVVRYSFDDVADLPGTYRYFVVPYDLESGEEGRASLALVKQ